MVAKCEVKAAARAAGLSRYSNGVPCPKGHMAERLVSSGFCSECNRERERGRKRARDSGERRKANRRYMAKPEKREQRRILDQNRRAKSHAAEGTHSRSDIEAISKMQGDKCAYCRVRLRGKGHVDHIIALARGGTNWPSNLQIVCKPCNSRKSASDPIDFAQSTGRLL